MAKLCLNQNNDNKLPPLTKTVRVIKRVKVKEETIPLIVTIRSRYSVIHDLSLDIPRDLNLTIQFCRPSETLQIPERFKGRTRKNLITDCR